MPPTALPKRTTTWPLLLLLHLAAYGITGLVFHDNLGLLAVVLAGCLIWPSITDLQRYEIPDLASLLLLVTGLAAGLWLGPTNWLDRAAGAILWPAIFLAIGYGFQALRGYPGLGMGDVKLMAGIGLWLGFLGSVYVVMAAALAGIVYLILGARRMGATLSEIPQLAIPFGTFLCFSAWVVWVFLGSP